MVEPRLRRQRVVARHRDRAGRHRAVHPDLRAAHHHPRDAGPPGPAAHAGRRRRRGRLRRRLRGAAAGRVRPGRAGTHRDASGRATCSIPTARSRRCTGRRRPTSSSSYIMRRGQPGLRGVHLLRVPLPADRRTPAQPLDADDIVAARPGTPPCPTCPRPTFSSDNRMLNAVWRLNARSCLYCSNEQFVDTPTREKGPFLWDASNESEGVMRAYGDQNMTWQALRDVARGQARYWPDGQVNAVYPNGDGARTSPPPRRAIPSGCGATTPRRATAPRSVRCTRRWPRPSPLAVERPPGRHRAALRAGRHRATATPSTATTSPWRPTRPATCWP